MSATLQPAPTPSPDQVRKYLARWREGDNERNRCRADGNIPSSAQEQRCRRGWGQDRSIKRSLLDQRVRLIQVARHIVSLDIDAALAEPGVKPDLIERIANVEISGKRRRNYSFATKYCNFRRPDVYPIYDSLVAGVLNVLLRQGEAFDSFARGERWGTDYAIWHRSITRFRTHYGLGEFPIRDIGKYLWMLGEERNAMRAGQPSASEGPPAV